jgi:hypothetical protein
MSSVIAKREFLDTRETTAVWPGLNRWRQIETPAMWFLLLNCLDAALTYILLMYPRLDHETQAFETNHMARFFLDRWGIAGMFAFKLASAMTVCTIAFVIAQRNVTTARRTLAFGTLILATVVIYSAHLAFGYIHG